MISAIHYNDDSTASRMLDMVARGGPRLMRTGGGAISSEQVAHGGTKSGARISSETRARILVLGRNGDLSPSEIARKLGTTQSTVRNLLTREGVEIVNKKRGTTYVK